MKPSASQPTALTASPALRRPAVAAVAVAREAAMAGDQLALRRPEPPKRRESLVTFSKVDLAVPLAMGMCGVGGFGWLLATAPGGPGAFSAMAFGMLGLLALGVLMGASSLEVKVPKLRRMEPALKDTVAGILGMAAPGIGLVGAGLLAKALGLTGGLAAGLIALGCLAGIAIFNQTK